MNIVVAGSISFLEEMREAKKKLVRSGHKVTIPDSVEQKKVKKDADIKIKNDLLRSYYKKIKNCDALLVYNLEKNDIAGYIGGNTFLEMGFAYVLNKSIFVLNQLPKELNYYQELLAMQPRVIDGDLSKLMD